MSCCASPDVDTFLFLWKHSALSFGHWNTPLICTAAFGRDEKMCSTTMDEFETEAATLYPASNKDWKLEILWRVSAASTADLVTCIDTHWSGFCFWGSLRPGVSTNISLGWEMSLLGRWLEVPAGEAALLLKLHPLAHLVSLDQAAKLWSVLVVGYH